jgi:hypothetical protein
MTESKRAIVVAEGDLHSGSKLGLMSPDTLLQEEELTKDGGVVINWYSPSLTETQKVIQKARQKGVEEVKALAGKDPIYLFELGDMTHGDGYPSELVTTRKADQGLIAYYNLLEWYKLPNLKSILFSMGTGSHVFGFGSSEIELCHRLKQEFPKKKTEIAYHWLADVLGIQFDLAHHGAGAGIRHWLRGNVTRYYLRDIMYTEFFAGRTPPDIVLRAHFHTYVKEFLSITFQGKEYESYIYVIPPLCIPGDYAIKVIKSVYDIQVGLLAFEVIDGQIRNTFKFTQSFDTRIKEKLL